MTDRHADIWQEVETWCRGEAQAARLAQVSVVLASLRGYLTLTEGKRGRTARSLLNELDAQRTAMRTMPVACLTLVQAYWDRLEQDLYELILPPDVRQQAADAVDCHGQPWGALLKTCLEARGTAPKLLESVRATVLPEGLRAYRARYLAHLRAACADPSVQTRLDEIIGAGVMRGRGKTQGASIKNWPLVSETIMLVYALLWPCYVMSSDDSSESTRAVSHDEGPAYPQVLLEAVARLFTTEFPDCIADLTAQDVLSRVQYRASDPRWANHVKLMCRG